MHTQDIRTGWLITGASSGFGRIMTERLLARGDRVVATVRQPQALDSLQQQYGEALQVEILEITDTAALRRVVARAFNRQTRIDRVVSNAGYGLFGAAEMLTDAQIEQQLATNLTGSIQLIRAVLPYLRDQGGGRIVQISSEGGQTAYPGFSLYHAGKWGIEGFIEAVAQEVAPFGIDFMIAEPGPTQTGFGAGLVQAESMGCYQATAVGDVQQALAAGNFGRWNDPYRSIDALIEATDRPDAPFRLAFGSTAYHHIQSALTRRLDTLRQHQAVSLATDSPPDSQT